MPTAPFTFIGIDVGGPRKGLHAVALRGSEFEVLALRDIAAVTNWVAKHKPAAIAIDAPCAWSAHGASRECERSLHLDGQRISCFSTPTEQKARGRSFYDWVRHGLALYAALSDAYPLYSGRRPRGRVMCETFPQAVACMLAGRKVPARNKSRVRRQVLSEAGYDPGGLHNIDQVDAALCALAAKALMQNLHQKFGNPQEGFIVTPRS